MTPSNIAGTPSSLAAIRQAELRCPKCIRPLIPGMRTTRWSFNETRLSQAVAECAQAVRGRFRRIGHAFSRPWQGGAYHLFKLRAGDEGVRLMRRGRRRGALASSASIAANSFSMARADGLPSVSLR